MKHKRLSLSSLLLLFLGLTGLQAQSILYVKEKMGMQTPIALSIVKKLTFPPDSLVISRTKGGTGTYGLSSLRYLSFTDFTTDAPQIEINGNISLSLFSNPVADHLQISYQMAQAASVQFAIVNMQGSIVQQQILSSQSGTNQASILVAQLPVGLYIIRLQSSTKLATIKFYKK